MHGWMNISTVGCEQKFRDKLMENSWVAAWKIHG